MYRIALFLPGKTGARSFMGAKYSKESQETKFIARP
jgi:hypothetical protein